MVDTELLEQTIREKGIKLSFISAEIGLSRQALYRKMHNDNEFVSSEVIGISRILGLEPAERDKIFFNSEC